MWLKSLIENAIVEHIGDTDIDDLADNLPYFMGDIQEALQALGPIEQLLAPELDSLIDQQVEA